MASRFQVAGSVLLLVSVSCTAAACGATFCLQDNNDIAAINLLQKAALKQMNQKQLPETQIAIERVNATKEQMQRLDAAKPIYWFHVPKCGSTFLNVLFQHPWICPGSRSTDSISADNTDINTFAPFQESVDQKCPGSFADGKHIGLHKGIASRYKDLDLKGHLVTMFREPKSRLISAYNFGMHSWPYHNRDNVTLMDYAAVARGHFLKMLIRDYSLGFPAKERREFFSDPTEHEIHEAHKRLHEGFAYVGITEEWKLSMCLFHRMFGGQCVAAEFWKVHESKSKRKEALLPQQEEEMKSFEDPFDGPLYQKALQRFQADLAKYNVSEQSCQSCFRHAGAMD